MLTNCHCSLRSNEKRCVLKVTGIEGNYRMTCERVLEVLRNHRDSVMAVLEAFVYDPLLNWRLMDGWFPIDVYQRFISPAMAYTILFC